MQLLRQCHMCSACLGVQLLEYNYALSTKALLTMMWKLSAVPFAYTFGRP